MPLDKISYVEKYGNKFSKLSDLTETVALNFRITVAILISFFPASLSWSLLAHFSLYIIPQIVLSFRVSKI